MEADRHTPGTIDNRTSKAAKSGGYFCRREEHLPEGETPAQQVGAHSVPVGVGIPPLLRGTPATIAATQQTN